MFFSRRAGVICVHRDKLGDPDFDTDDFTKDGAYHTLDLSSVIPKNTKLVVLRFVTACVIANYYIKLKRNGAGDTNNIEAEKQLTTGPFTEFTLIVSPDADGCIEYLMTSGVWPLCDCTVGEYFV